MASATGHGEAASVVTDAEDDVRLWLLSGQEGPALPATTHAHLDILKAWIANETVEDFEVGVQLKRWEDPYAASALMERTVILGFHFGGLSYVVVHSLAIAATRGCTAGQVVLGISDNENLAPWTPLQCIDGVVRAGEGTLHVTVPKEAIHGGNGVTLQPSDTLTRFFALAQSFQGAGWARDRAPDTEYGPDFLSTQGRFERHGDLFLTPVQPLRASNGEATTMVFPVRLTNLGPTDDTVHLSIENTYAPFTLRTPARVHVPAGGTHTFPVILSMGFTHAHGTTEFFAVRAESTASPGHYAVAQMGVHWHEIPQPAGHHPLFWFYSAPTEFGIQGVNAPHEVFGLRNVWFNAIHEDPRIGATKQSAGGGHFPGSNQTSWIMPLDPPLQIGLNLDTSQVGHFETAIRSYVPATRATLAVEVRYCDPTGTLPGPPTSYCGTVENPGTMATLLAGRSDPRGLPTNGVAEFVVALDHKAPTDIIPQRPGAQLLLLLVLSHDTPQGYYLYGNPPGAQLVVAESELYLPLFEYHDPVDQAFLNIGTLTLEALDVHEKRVNPGRGVVFGFDVTNTADSEQTVRLAAEGHNEAWAAVWGDTEVRLAPGATHKATVLVRAPEFAQPGERAELFFVVENVADPSVVALARLRASVVSADVADLPDEMDLLPAHGTGATTDFLTGLVVVLVLVAVGAVKRRSR